MTTWPTVTIGDVCERTEQRDPRRAPDEQIRYIDISGIDRDRKFIAEAQPMSGAGAPSRARKVVRSGDVIVSTVRPNLNAVAVVPDELDGEIASTGFCVLRPKKGLSTTRYLFCRATSPEFVNALSAKVKGASYPAVTDGDVRELPLPLPPLSEQRRIVEILDQADHLRRLRAEANTKADRILPALFLKMFGDPATNPMGLRKEPLGEVIRVRSGNFLRRKEMDQDGDFPVYGGNGVSGYHSEFMLEEPAIVIGRVGVYCGVVHYTAPMSWVTDNALYVSEKKIDVNDRYLAEALRLANLNQYAGRAAQPLVSGSRIYPVEILLPDEPAQQCFAERADRIEQIASQQTASSGAIDPLWSSLVGSAFAGSLTRSWREAHLDQLAQEIEAQARALQEAR